MLIASWISIQLLASSDTWPEAAIIGTIALAIVVITFINRYFDNKK